MHNVELRDTHPNSSQHMILTTLFLTSLFVTGTALCSRGSFQLGLIVSNPDAIRSGYVRTAFNLAGQTALVLMAQPFISFWAVSVVNASVPALFVFTLAFWGVTTVVAVTLGVLGYIMGRKSVETIKADLSTFVPGGGYAPVMDLEITWKDQAGLGYRTYRFIDAVILPSVLFCTAIGLWWLFAFN